MCVYGRIVAPAAMRAFLTTQYAPTRTPSPSSTAAFEDAADVDLDVAAAAQLAALVEAGRVGEANAAAISRAAAARW